MIFGRRQIGIIIALTPIVIFVIGQGCSDTKLGKFMTPSQASISFCTTPAQSIQSDLKYIFVFDHSGSNQQNYILDPANPTNPPIIDTYGGTDPLGQKRYPPLIQFLGSIQDNANTYYSVINFGDAAVTRQNWKVGGNRVTAAQTINFLQSEVIANPGPPPHPVDGGGTNYDATLSNIIALVSADIMNAKNAALAGNPIVSSDYVIFWVSDGAPYVNTQLQNLPGLLGKIKALTDLRTNDPDYVDSITFNTGFYHNFHDPSIMDNVNQWGYAQDQLAASYLSQMATAGQGVFLDFQNAVIDYTKFSVPLRTAKFQLKDVWIQNLNTVWWQGKLMADADGDGLPDDVERQMGSNFAKYDSDGNGVGDGVEYYVTGQPCKAANCSVGGAASYQQQCGPLPGAGYIDLDKDGLNDCEEKVLGSKFDDFDSNQDYAPDEFAWVSGISFLQGAIDLQSDPDGDGQSNYFELKHNTPVRFNNKNIVSMFSMNYFANQISDNTSQTCYQLNVDKLAVMTNQDVIRVYVMEARGAVGSHRNMRVAQKKSSNGILILNDSDFK